jgi:outer membrane protein with beta-barrel domain
MKPLKIEIYNFLIVSILFFTLPVNASTLWLKTGIYDFKNDASKEFYKFGWSIRVSYDFYEHAGFAFNVISGSSYSTVPYKGNKHNMLIVPFQLSWKYTIPIKGTQFHPFFGSGIGVYGKMDYNQQFPKKRYALTYGYHFFSGLDVQVSERIKTSFGIIYNTLITPSTEDINVSGLDILVGVGYMF